MTGLHVRNWSGAGAGMWGELAGLGWAGLGWAGLGWAGWAGLGRVNDWQQTGHRGTAAPLRTMNRFHIQTFCHATGSSSDG